MPVIIPQMPWGGRRWGTIGSGTGGDGLAPGPALETGAGIRGRAKRPSSWTSWREARVRVPPTRGGLRSSGGFGRARDEANPARRAPGSAVLDRARDALGPRPTARHGATGTERPSATALGPTVEARGRGAGAASPAEAVASLGAPSPADGPMGRRGRARTRLGGPSLCPGSGLRSRGTRNAPARVAAPTQINCVPIPQPVSVAAYQRARRRRQAGPDAPPSGGRKGRIE